MTLLLIKRVLFGRKKKRALEQNSHRNPAEQADEMLPVSTQRRIPEWEDVLTSSLKENCLAPADEVILHAFDLYCDELNKPVHERQRHMAGLFSEVTTEFAQLQSLAPDMVERAAAKHRLELNHFTDSKIAKLEEDKLRLNDKLAQNQQPKATKGEIFELLKGFLSNPCNLYEKSTLNTRKTILKTAFKAPLAYDRETGFRTPQTSVIFEFFADFTSKCEMVPTGGLELLS